MKTKNSFLLAGLLVLASCGNNSENTVGYPTVNLRDALANTETIPLADEIQEAVYVPLEVTGDDDSLIDGVALFAVSSKYIYVLPNKEQRIVQFGRDGKFIRTLIREGQGPGEFAGTICDMQVDEANDRLFLFDVQDVWVYTAEGKFVEKKHHESMSVYSYLLAENQIGAVSFPFMPFEQGSYGLGIFTTDGEPVLTRNEMFYHSAVSKEKSGFTVDMAASFVDEPSSILFKTGSNDTIYRVKANGIDPVCVVKLDNSEKQIVRSLDVTDMASMLSLESGSDIALTDIMETKSRFYIRFRYHQQNHVASIDKTTQKVKVEKCDQPVDAKELSGINFLQGMSGSKSFQNFPIWGRVIGKELVQLITPGELLLYKEETSITIPEALQAVNKDSNPVFVFYWLKKSL